MEVLGHVVSKKKIFLCLFRCKSMGANDPWGGAISDTRGMLGRIYVKLHITMLHTKYRSFGCCGFREEDFFHIFSINKPMADNDAPVAGPVWTPGAQLARFIEDYYTLLHTKYESSGPCGFGEEFFFSFP